MQFILFFASLKEITNIKKETIQNTVRIHR
mgnify:CR=1 FL=1